VSCDDGVDCTVDQCEEATTSCSHVPNAATCDDGLFCTVDTCNPALPGTGCSHAPLSCPDTDGVACTSDVCSEASDSCLVSAQNDLCPAGQLCAPGVGCSVVACTQDADCDDGNPCNGVETCKAKACQAGTPFDCGDATACSTDTCDPGDGSCSHVPNDAVCQDGTLCNGDEVCVLGVGCQPGPPHVCTSSIPCITMACDVAQDACVPAGTDDSACPCGQTCDPQLGCGDYCVVASCSGKVFECGDCLDNDGDCTVDSNDAHCTGPCDDSEKTFEATPYAVDAHCKLDCYFDFDAGSGNDECYWDSRCDPKEPQAFDYCQYDPYFVFPGQLTCADRATSQSQWCLGYCLPVTPNGCDCFGCCEVAVPGTTTKATVFLGTRDSTHQGVCDLASLADPKKCAPCTQVPSCLNPCDTCELCVGKSELPVSCASQVCPSGVQQCGLPGQSPCPAGQSCITGCCRNNLN